jgi:hypothetical protein
MYVNYYCTRFTVATSMHLNVIYVYNIVMYNIIYMYYMYNDECSILQSSAATRGHYCKKAKVHMAPCTLLHIVIHVRAMYVN